MNPRLVEPGFVAACLHVDGPARPGKDENGEDEAQQSRRHGKRDDTETMGAAQARGSVPHDLVRRVGRVLWIGKPGGTLA
jgi:hypothetical protein